MKPQFTSYTAQALAADDAFIGWVLQGRDDAAWREWLRAHPEAERSRKPGRWCATFQAC